MTILLLTETLTDSCEPNGYLFFILKDVTYTKYKKELFCCNEIDS